MQRHLLATLILPLIGISGCSKHQPEPMMRVLVEKGTKIPTLHTSKPVGTILKNDEVLQQLADKYGLAFSSSRQKLVSELRDSLIVEEIEGTSVCQLSSTLKPRTLAVAMLQLWLDEVERELAKESEELIALREKTKQAEKRYSELRSAYEAFRQQHPISPPEKENLAKKHELEVAAQGYEEVREALASLGMKLDVNRWNVAVVMEDSTAFTAEEIAEYKKLRLQCKNLPVIKFTQTK